MSMSMFIMSVLPFFASMSSQASVFLGKGMAAQTELLQSPLFKQLEYKLNNKITILIILILLCREQRLSHSQTSCDELRQMDQDQVCITAEHVLKKYFANHNRKAQNSKIQGKSDILRKKKNHEHISAVLTTLQCGKLLGLSPSSPTQMEICH